jgi:predicted 3-demethylubiquinone-9 3-methyltransferase (glyoxalase superfamily)
LRHSSGLIDNAEEAAKFYLSVFPHARKLDELRSKGVGPWPVGKIAMGLAPWINLPQ